MTAASAATPASPATETAAPDGSPAPTPDTGRVQLALNVDDLAAGIAEDVLGLRGELAVRYVERLKDPAQGLVPSAGSDLEGLASVVALRRRYLPRVIDGRDVLDGALDPSSGLVDQADGR